MLFLRECKCFFFFFFKIIRISGMLQKNKALHLFISSCVLAFN
jgi:hypothetical protein